MKLSILDTERFVSVNKIKQVTSPRLFSNKQIFEPNGILSNEIFGVSTHDRKTTFAYIDLFQPFIHPHIYHNVLKGFEKKILYVVSGTKRYSVGENGLLVDDPNGWTGLRALYDNWDKIKWNSKESDNARSKNLLKNLPRNQVFVTKLVVCPPFYRDIWLAGDSDPSDRMNEVNKMYTKVINLVGLLEEGGMFARTNYATQANIQDSLVDIFKYYCDRISGKFGIIKRNLMGKNASYGTRAVISAPSYNVERMSDNIIDIETAAVPISQCCALFYPFIESWVKNFFTREVVNDPNNIVYYDVEGRKEIVTSLLSPDIQFSDKNVANMIEDYVRNPDGRFKTIIVNAKPTGDGQKPIKVGLMLVGKKLINNSQISFKRPLTLTDILYLACVDVCEKRHVKLARYPVGTDKGNYFNKIRVQSTKTHEPIIFNGTEYKFYPKIDPKIEHSLVGIQFIDSLVSSNSNLEGIGGDYDGDQVASIGLWSDEANAEAERIMNSKMSALTSTGNNIKVVSKEVVNSYYELTKMSEKQSNINNMDTNTYLGMTPDEYTRTFICRMLADRVDNSQGKSTNRIKARHQTWDKMIVPVDYFFQGPVITTTIGRFLFNKFVLQGANIIHATGYINDVLNKGGLGKIDRLIGELYLTDKIDRRQFNQYIDRRDTLGYWLNGMLSHTISPRMAKPLPEIEKRKQELFKKYAKELEAGNIAVMTQIEKELVDYAQELLKDDPGMDLYLSGDLNIENYKNNSILKGPVMNKATGQYDFIKTSFMNGIQVEDIPAHANSIVAGQYPASIKTAAVGYMGKQILALLQMSVVDERGTDCGTKRTIPLTITKENLYDYIMVSGKPVLLDNTTIGKYLGKVCDLRSPCVCTTEKYCNICAGELPYMLGNEAIGFTASEVSHALLNKNLKKKHSAGVTVGRIDVTKIIKDT